MNKREAKKFLADHVVVSHVGFDSAEYLKKRNEALGKSERLLAAAPDLIKALQNLSPWNLQDCWCAVPDASVAGQVKHHEACLRARDALKKAGVLP